MFNVGDEVELIDDSLDEFKLENWEGGVPFPLKKGDTFIVRGLIPAFTWNGVWALDEPGIQIGVEHRGWRLFVQTHKLQPPKTYDQWPACRFRKIERKSIYSMLGIPETLKPTKTPELTDAR